ncbi:MAG TPA: hypothetical protein VN025_05470 [Candidatus Dormibacteraeota bacterium]|jgi:hypothetical protein|nr:hypothetical protein [Candidatus Dormibacteraeota bacterium]
MPLGDNDVNKTLTTLKIPAAPRADGSKQTQWDELRAVFPIYLALAKQLEIKIPFGQDKRSLPEKVEPTLFVEVQTWLDALDQQVQVHQLRHLLQMTTLNASESGLRALILRHLRKSSKTTTDRDKIDFLLVQYFALCAPAKIYHKQIELPDAAQVMKGVLGEVDTTPLEWCEPLEKMIESLRGFRGLRDLLKTNFIEQGRRVKESAGGMFYDPSALLAFIRFNFLLRRTLIELMHADLIAIRAGLGQLESAGVRIIDCHHLGLSAAEPIDKIRFMADEWKQPFQKEYTERTVSQAFDKLLGLRTDVERALERVAGKTSESAPSAPAGGGLKASSHAKPVEQAAPRIANNAAANQKEHNKEVSTDVPVILDFESCMEAIWEQLIAAPPTRGRSMTTIRLGTARILMSSWEVSAFVSEDGFAAEDLRRAVVARALVTTAVEHAKETGNATSLEKSLMIARVEVSRLQERVDAAKQAKDTEAAVNLGISTKRLLSALDEAEKL